ncbi:PQQ-binding-like beta-propeller repeat protein [Pelagicoccus sp. SDUM812003]|uniref:outer membrane protein assembly factor BamB family protein n=1 Tax=Pelagicoccus sp. SDUM812003 TaxID=3041267 RepID=UPI00280FF235|nr:PQQ-binding-like beta-propeller repeat protein [Pelagicoccus sp. SDUM812003]MDQ8204296.1 PQQ-binding-like beta-propeller repeat protein [Pelagicoccus sp. SDUM812003]
MSGSNLRAEGLDRSSLLGNWSGILAFGDQQAEVFYEIDEEEGKLVSWLTLEKGGLYAMGPSVVERDEAGVWKLDWFGRVYSVDGNGQLIGAFQHYDKALELVLEKVDTVPPKPKEKWAVDEPRVDWVVEVAGGVWAAPAAGQGLVLVGDDSGMVTAMHDDTGNVAWRFRTGAGIYASPKLDEDFLYASSDDGYVYCLAVGDGVERWRTRLGGGFMERSARLPRVDDGAYDYRSSSPVIVEGTLFVGGAKGGVWALDTETGEVLWEFVTEGRVSGDVAVAGDVLVFGCRDGRVYAIDRNSGSERWRHEVGAEVVSTPAVHDGLAIVGSRNASLLALDVETGQPRWESLTWTSWVESSGVVSGERMFIGSSDVAKLCARKLDTGEIGWERFLGGSLWAKPAVAGRRVYAGVTGSVGYFAPHVGAFACVDAESGELVWRMEFEPTEEAFLYGCPGGGVTEGERVYFGTLDGRVFAVKR